MIAFLANGGGGDCHLEKKGLNPLIVPEFAPLQGGIGEENKRGLRRPEPKIY